VERVELQVLLTHPQQQLLPPMVVWVQLKGSLREPLVRVELVQHQMAQLERQLTTTVGLVDSQHRSQAHR
jgi:hypothetical protein